MKRYPFAQVLAIPLVAALVRGVVADDWPQWGGDPQRNMAADEPGLPDDFHSGRKKRNRLGFDPSTARNVRFIARPGSENYSSPVVAGGRVYIGTNDEEIDDSRFEPTRGGVLLCLDERTGELVWRLVVPRLEIDRSKVSEDFDDMNLGICSTATGDVSGTGVRWHYTGIGRSLSIASVAGGLVYSAEHAGKVHCLDAESGSLVWVHDTREEIWSSTFVADGKVFIGTRKGLTVLAAGRERRQIAEIKLGTPVWSVACAANDTLFVASQKNLWAVARPPSR